MPSKKYLEIMNSLDRIEMDFLRKNNRDKKLMDIAGSHIDNINDVNKQVYNEGYNKGARDMYAKLFPQDNGGGTSKKEESVRVLAPPS